MSRIAYVNGAYVRRGEAGISIEDRGFLFADGVYEVCELRGGRLVDEERHLDRLDRSMAELRLTPPMPRRALQAVLRETVRRNRIAEGIIYFQVTRGAARRDHGFPPPGTPASLTIFVSPIDVAKRERAVRHGVTVRTAPDERWKRRDIKSVSLLPNVMAKQAAREAGAYEAWMVDSAGYITEGASTNAWIVTHQGVLVTRPLGPDILPGITRQGVLEAGSALQVPVEERPFTVEEARSAAEAFLTSSSAVILPVVAIDGQKVGTGEPGRVTLRIRDAARVNCVISPVHLPSI